MVVILLRLEDLQIDLIYRCKLMDMGALGSKFTWKGRILNGVRTFRRLDRGVCNSDWRVAFPEAVVRVLPRIDFSDHHPLLIEPFGVVTNFRNKPFRFERHWQVHPLYNDVIKNCWREDLSIMVNISNMEEALKLWKRNVFGDKNRKKKRLLARIGGIQRKIMLGETNRFLTRLEAELQKDLNNVLAHEEMMWHQRSRSKWLSDGDRNTHFYHVKALNRRRKNKILALRNDQGVWQDNEADVKELVNNFYKNLFIEEHVFGAWFHSNFTFGVLNNDISNSLCGDVTLDEVKKVVFHMGAWKAPGPTVSPGFY